MVVVGGVEVLMCFVYGCGGVSWVVLVWGFFVEVF